MRVVSERGRGMNSLPNFLRDEVKKVRGAVKRGEEAARTGEATDDQVRTFFFLLSCELSEHYQLESR